MSSKTSLTRRTEGALTRAAGNLRVLGGVSATLWAIEVVDLVLGGALDQLGVIPRTTVGLRGILFAPLLHGGFGHLLANTLALIPLGFLVMGQRRRDFALVSVVSALTAGLGAWLFGAPGSVHIGASGVIFGYLGFLLGRGIFDRRPGPIVLSVFTAFFFGGMLGGLVPIGNAGISWQSHLFGLLGGLFLARLRGRKSR